MAHHSDIQEYPTIQEKLVLPTDFDAENSFDNNFQDEAYDPNSIAQDETLSLHAINHNYAGFTQQGGNIPADSAIVPKSSRRSFWHRSPAHKVFVIALVIALMMGMVSAAVMGTMFIRQGLFAFNPAPKTITPETTHPQPTFPAPTGGVGSQSSSLPPVHSTETVPTTTATPNATVQPSPTGQVTSTPTPGGQITIQLSVPLSVKRGNNVNIFVHTSQGNVDVTLVVKYDPLGSKRLKGKTGNNGDGMILWHVPYLVTSATINATAQNAQPQSYSVSIRWR